MGETRLLLDGETHIDAIMNMLVDNVGDLVIPTRWKTFRVWDDVVQAAIKDNPRLGNRRYRNDGVPIIELKPEAEETVKEIIGDAPYIRRVAIDDKVTRQYLIRRFPFNRSWGEVRLAWYPMLDLNAQLNIRKGKSLERQIEATITDWENEPTLFPEFNDRQADALRERLGLLRNIRHCRQLLRKVLTILGNRGDNPVIIPAWEMKDCYPERGLEDIHCLFAILGRMELSLSVPGMRHLTPQPLIDVFYHDGGRGKRGDGEYHVKVSGMATAALGVFATLDGNFDYQKKVKKADMKGSQYLVQPTCLLPHYDAAAALTPSQSKFLNMLSHNITRNVDAAPKGRKGIKLKHTHPNARLFRAYDSKFCPAIPEGRVMCGALGHFKRNPEGGWRVFTRGGTRAHQGGGGHSEGLMAVMGYHLTHGARASVQNREIIRNAFRDLAIVIQRLNGVLGIRYQAEWIDVDTAAALPMPDIRADVRIFPFLPMNWIETARDTIREYQAGRLANGDQTFNVDITENPKEKARAEQNRGRGGAVSVVDDIRVKMAKERADRGLSMGDLADILGVSKNTISVWERGVKGIPDERAEQIRQWMETPK